MAINKERNFRLIKQSSISIPCYFYGAFKSPGLANYPDLEWVNDDYNLIKSKTLSHNDCLRIANNLFLVGEKFDLFSKIDYFVMMPFKSTSISSLDQVISALIAIIQKKLKRDIRLISDVFTVEDYRKFWENRLNLQERKKEITKKIALQEKYYHFFDGKNIIVIDDVVSTGISIAEVILNLKKFNNNCNAMALTYGSVYQWEKIYS